MKGTLYQEEVCKPIISDLEEKIHNFQNFQEVFKKLSTCIKLERRISQTLIGFDMFLVRETIYRCKNSFSVSNIHAVVKDIFFELLSPFPAVYLNFNQPIFLIIPTQIPELRSSNIHRFETIWHAINFYKQCVYNLEKFFFEKATVEKTLVKIVNKTKSQLPKLEEVLLSSSWQKNQHFGELLTAYTYYDRPNKNLICVTDYTTNKQINIPTKPKLSLSENASAYFEKAKLEKTRNHLLKKKYKSFETLLANQTKALTELQNAQNAKQFAVWKQKHNQTLLKSGLISKKDRCKETLFRSFSISKNATLFVGKNSANNDLLTFKYAKPNDYWLHARGCSGSHCILKYSGGTKPLMENIEIACSIAAFYSTARGSEFVPVIYTQKKYVRKPKKSQPGSVIIEKENVLIVKPKKFSSE